VQWFSPGAGPGTEFLGNRSPTRCKFQPATVSVNVVRNPGDYANLASTTTDPNPVFAELQSAGSPP